MKQMYFGTRERMTWIPCPAIDADLSKVGWSAAGRYLNGGGWVRRSATAGKTYRFSWNLMEQAELRKFLDYADGLYGQGPFYFIDPFATENVLPAYWASPRLAALDAPPLVTDHRPTLVDTPDNNYGYPTKSAVYTVDADDEFSEIWLPVPEGYTLHFGAHGSADAGVELTLTEDGQTPRAVELMGLSNDLTNTTAQGPSGVTVSGRTRSVVHEWTGTPHASASVERVNGVVTRQNLAVQPRSGNSLPWVHTAGASGSLAVAAGSTPVPEVQSFSRLTFSQVPANFVGIYYREEGLDGSAGDTVPISMWVRPSKDATIRLDSSTRFGSTTVTTAMSAEVFVSAGTWHRIEQPVTSSAAYNGCQGWVRVVDASTAFGPGDTLDVAAVLVGATGPYFDGDSPDIAPGGTLTLNSMVAALVPNGEPAPTGAFPSGQGHSGVDFENHPSVNGYSAALDKMGASATLLEVGAWL